jgi:hypothetical protein
MSWKEFALQLIRSELCLEVCRKGRKIRVGLGLTLLNQIIRDGEF